MMKKQYLGILCAVSKVCSKPLSASEHPGLHARDATTATVTLSSDRGTPSHLVSGMLYGIPDTGDQIPDEFYAGMGFNYGRAGGAQLPQKGWIGGVDDYNARFQSALLNYRTARQHGGRHQLLVHDLWGADSLQSSDAPFPGDSGDWSSFDSFLDNLVTDIDANGMREGLDLEIWNEPDNGPFWGRDQTQYLLTWQRAYQKFRDAFGTDLPIVGPSTLSQPATDNEWWTTYLRFIVDNNVVPDQYSWHLLLNADDPNVDPEQSFQNLEGLRATYNLPERPCTCNEFALQNEQTPGGITWYLSRFERNDVRGLRANYNFYGGLHDFFAGLLGKPNANTDSYDPKAGGYWANGEWQLYKYYTNSMTGSRLATAGSADRKFEAYGTKDNDAFKVIVSARLKTGIWSLVIQDLSSVGLPESGSIQLRRMRFDFTDGTYGNVGEPVDEGVQSYDYSEDQVVIPVQIENYDVAYAYQYEP